MKTITIVTDQITDRALAAALPTEGITSMTIARGQAPRPGCAEIRRYRTPHRFAPAFRIDLVVADDAVASVFDGIDVAYGAGLFSDAEAWVGEPAMPAAA